MALLPSNYGPADVLGRVEWALADRRAAMLDELDLALAWADLHGDEPAVRVAGGEQLVRLGGEGTPLVADLALEELAVARQEHVLSTRSVMADVLDLRHRLPRLWALVRSLQVEAWVARKVAVMSRKLDRSAVVLVDRAVAAAVGQAPSRMLAVVEAKVIEADTALREAELEAARSTKGVWVTGGDRPGERDEEGAGLRGVFARVEAADAIWVDATVQRIADLLAAEPDLRLRHHPELGEEPSADELRAAAFAWLARPHDLAALLGELDDSGKTATSDEPTAVLYVHLHQAALTGDVDGVARCDGRAELGPLLLSQVTALLRHANVTLKPVIDLNSGASVNGYEHPEAVKERTRLRMLGDAFPHAAGLSRRVDHDHVTPYDPGGPPGQTGDHNVAPLSRRSHRAKTHRRYDVEQLAPAVYLWRTSRGLWRLVNHTGTHRVTEDDAELLRGLYGVSAHAA